MNKTNTKTIVIVASMIGIVLLSGCIGNNNSNSDSKITPVITPSATQKINNSILNNVSNSTNNLTSPIKSANLTSSNNSTTKESSVWCEPNESLVTGGKTFVIQGLITENGKSLCYARSVDSKTNSTTNYYFSQDGKIKKMNSVNVSPNGSARSSASSSIE